MKELSIEEKAKAYDEAIERAKSLLSGNQLGNAWIYKLLPELKENEDERIRNFISNELACLRATDEKGSDRYEELTNAIAWLEKQGKNDMGISEATKQKLEDNLNKALEKETPESWNEFLEKQGEQKPTDKVEPKFKVGDIITPKDGGHEPWQIMQVDILDKKYRFKEGYVIHFSQEDDYELVEQKPAWSEEDEKILRTIISDGIRGAEFDMLQINWLKSLKERVQPQPKQEWSERDKEEFHIAIETLAEAGQHDSAHWLQFLKERYTWKPTTEQLRELRCVISGCSFETPILVELEESLKKLKG